MKYGLLFIIGGLMAGGGIVTGLAGGFGVEGGDIATVFSTLGYDAVDDLRVTGQGMLAIVLFVCGVGCLVAGNRGAWKETGGY